MFPVLAVAPDVSQIYGSRPCKAKGVYCCYCSGRDESFEENCGDLHISDIILFLSPKSCNLSSPTYDVDLPQKSEIHAPWVIVAEKYNSLSFKCICLEW